MKAIGLLLGCLLYSMLAFAQEKSSAVDGIQKITQMTEQMEDAKYALMTLWIDCELDQLCICENKRKLYETTNNITLKVIIEQDAQRDKERCDRIKEDYALCQVPLITDVNKALLPCYTKLRDGFYLNDQRIYETGMVCLVENLLPLVTANNPYALYVFLDFLETYPHKYPGMLGFYQKQFEALRGTQDYQVMLQCQDMLVQ